MSKHELIDAIRRRNISASPAFLLGFSDTELASYLRRLNLADQRGSAWVREGNDPAITVRDCLTRRSAAAA